MHVLFFYFCFVWFFYYLRTTLTNFGPHWVSWDQDTCPNVAARYEGDFFIGVLERRECSRDDSMSSILVLPNARSLKMQTSPENSAGTDPTPRRETDFRTGRDCATKPQSELRPRCTVVIKCAQCPQMRGMRRGAWTVGRTAARALDDAIRRSVSPAPRSGPKTPQTRRERQEDSDGRGRSRKN